MCHYFTGPATQFVTHMNLWQRRLCRRTVQVATEPCAVHASRIRFWPVYPAARKCRIKTFWTRQNGRYLADISAYQLVFFPKGLIDHYSALFQAMAWRQAVTWTSDDKYLCHHMTSQSPNLLRIVCDYIYGDLQINPVEMNICSYFKKWKKGHTKLIALILKWKLVIHHTWYEFAPQKWTT